MDTLRNESLIKLVLYTVDLLILRWQVDEAMWNKPVDWQEDCRLMRARDCWLNATRRCAAMNISTREFRA